MFRTDFFDLENPGVLPSNGSYLDISWTPVSGDPPGPPAPPPPPPPPPDPRTPIQKLLERFQSPEDEEERAAVKHWNEVELPEQKREKARAEAEADKLKRRILTGPVEDADTLQYAHDAEQAYRDHAEGMDVEKRTAAVDSDTDVHVSESAIPFPRWHLDAEGLQRVTFYNNEVENREKWWWAKKPKDAPPKPKTPPKIQQPADEFRASIPYVSPGRSIEEIERTGPDTKDDFTRVVECIRLARSMIPEVPVKAKGTKGVAPAGTLGHVKYDARNTEGLMYVEDPEGEYGKWFREIVLGEYYRHKKSFDELSANTASDPMKVLDARGKMRQAAACVAVAYQEGAPSAINTYDGLVLSWGIGIAGPGKLPKTFHEIMKDRHVYKAFYLCGFRYDGFVMGKEHHGAYQIVDLESDPPAIVYKDQYNHQPGAKPYDFEGNAYKILKYFTSQPKLIHLLIALSRDPLTRATILAPNYAMIQGFVLIVGDEHIHTDALHLFAAQVKHNWGFGTEIVKWAVSRFTDDERKTLGGIAESPPRTSEEKDKAIAKGIVRFLMGRLQLQRWQKAINTMRREEKGLIKDDKLGAKGKFLWQLPATTEFGYRRLLQNYWSTLKRGPSAQTTRPEVTGPGLAVVDFPEVSSPTSDTSYIWIQSQLKPGQPPNDSDTPKYYDLGPLHQFDLLFPHEEIRLIGFEKDKVVIENRGRRELVPENIAPKQWQAGQ